MAGIIAHDAPVRASDVHQLSRGIANISGQGQRLGYSDACQLAAMSGLQRLHKKITSTVLLSLCLRRRRRRRVATTTMSTTARESGRGRGRGKKGHACRRTGILDVASPWLNSLLTPLPPSRSPVVLLSLAEGGAKASEYTFTSKRDTKAVTQHKFEAWLIGPPARAHTRNTRPMHAPRTRGCWALRGNGGTQTSAFSHPA